MRRRCLDTERLRGATAWVLALLCLWMGTGGVLHHTDAFPGVGSASPLAAWGHATTPAAPADACAACQWTQGMQSGTFSVCQVILPQSFTTPRSCRVPTRLASRPLRLGSPRAPPLFLS